MNNCMNGHFRVDKLITTAGVIFVLMYVWEAIVSRFGEPDQSLLFWYLPILFLGLIASAGGLLLLLRSLNQIKHIRNDLL